jgi:hypothetical protein
VTARGAAQSQPFGIREDKPPSNVALRHLRQKARDANGRVVVVFRAKL